jgi:hypothetical protein
VYKLKVTLLLWILKLTSQRPLQTLINALQNDPRLV